MRSFRSWLLTGLGIASLGSFLYFLTTLGPRRVTKASAEIYAPGDPAVARLSAEIAALENEYAKAADVGLVTPEILDKLAQALAKQKELLRVYPRAGLDESVRLARLETTWGNEQAKAKAAEIDRLEKDGADALDNADCALASQKFTEALRLQHEINISSAGSRYKNYVRETSISQELARLEAAPLQKEMKAAVAEARQATDEKRWADALRAFTKARDLQDTINQKFGRTMFSDLAGVDDLNAEIESLNAAGIASEIDAKEKAGEDEITAGDAASAAEDFSRAGVLQLQINQKFPKSRFVSSDRIETLEIKKQTALSMNLADTLAALDKAVAEHLKKRQIVLAEQKIGQALDCVEKLFASYPKSRRLDGNLKIKLAYLALKRPSLRALQDGVYDALLPVEPGADRLLLKTEVSQELYVAVMNTNPSRNPGREFPVDSVNRDEAREFCTRLSWLLGTAVRLPTSDEMRTALGKTRPASWNKADSDGHSHEIGRRAPNGAGFYDLIGNVAEWTDSEADGGGEALVFGGSYLDSAEALAAVPVEKRSVGDRARHIGFRVLVELATK